MPGWNCEPEIRKNVQMTLSFVASVVEGIQKLEHMFQTDNGWAAELMTCTERCWPFSPGDKLWIIFSKTGEECKIRIEGEYAEFWNPDDENQTAFLAALLPKINDPASQFLMPSFRQLFLDILCRATDNLPDAERKMLAYILPRLNGASWELGDLVKNLFMTLQTRMKEGDSSV